MAGVLLLAALLAPSAWCGTDPFPGFPLAWFDEPERHAPHWNVTIGPPVLFYSQRFVIGATATFPPRSKKATEDPEWHIIIRVADDKGQWFDDFDYSRINVREIPRDAYRLRWYSDFFARPGTYRVVLLVYDAASEQHFLWRKTVHVKKPNLLPELDRDMPPVEFINGPVRHGFVREFLPVRAPQPVRIDVVLNLTGDLQLGLRSDVLSRIRQKYVESALQGATIVLSQLKPATGCVRVSAIDILHLDAPLDRTSADPQTTWDRVHQAMVKNRDSATVDVRTLQGRTKAREFFHQFLDRVISDRSGCGDELPEAQRAVIVVSDSLVFPKDTEDKEPFTSSSQRDIRFFHLRISAIPFVTFDQVGHMLDPLRPRRFDIRTPQDLRRTLAGIINDIEAQP